MGPCPATERLGKVCTWYFLWWKWLYLKIRGIPHHRKRVQILGSQKEEQRIK